MRYQCNHCCGNVANIACERLMTKLKNLSEFTQRAYLSGENAGGVAIADGMDGHSTFRLA
jgi:hypothetical protein